MALPEFKDSGASFDKIRRYRYSLWRWWGEGNGEKCNFVMLNPSTADENVLDPTVRRCAGFAYDWGYSGLTVTNLFALRSTDPKELYRAVGPTGGKENDNAILAAAMTSGCVVCAWGVHGVHMNRGKRVAQLLAEFEPVCLGLTREGQPKHPLYLKKSTKRRRLSALSTAPI